MKITVLLLLQLVCSAQSTAEADKEILAKQIALQQPCPQDVHAVLRELTASVAQQKVEMTFLQKENQEQTAKLKTEINNLKQQLEVRQVAFSVSLLTEGSATLGPFGTFTTLIFKHVITNIGNAYNPNTGMFTAPVRGAYHFEFYIGTSGASTAAVLVKNTNHIFATYEHQSSGFGSTAQGASLLLEAGDVVFVRLWVHNTIFDNQNRHTTFSGHLLFTM
ncbi:complement C1q-like protein 2 [Lates calcarifer]|uniref:Complement C1q-like protein 2 n=1 Tax=Lates calcarifer TaxID=8187 RepID=A0AAJ7PFU6_LATCA|nr:complement C1q-like protein 2 [Lates calcarifer]